MVRNHVLQKIGSNAERRIGMEIYAESGVGNVNNFYFSACYLFPARFHQAFYRYLLRWLISVTVAIGVKWITLLRAPRSEVQTNKWECFCSVFWDPLHADCAVPQVRTLFTNYSYIFFSSKPKQCTFIHVVFCFSFIHEKILRQILYILLGNPLRVHLLFVSSGTGNRWDHATTQVH